MFQLPAAFPPPCPPGAPPGPLLGPPRLPLDPFIRLLGSPGSLFGSPSASPGFVLGPPLDSLGHLLGPPWTPLEPPRTALEPKTKKETKNMEFGCPWGSFLGTPGHRKSF